MNKDDATWLKVAYIAFAGIIGFLGYKAAYTMSIQMEWQERYYDWIEYAQYGVALLFAVITYWYITASQSRHEYFLASLGELRKVAWPTFDDTKRMTAIVVVVVAIFSFVLWVFDMVWSKSLSLILT